MAKKKTDDPGVAYSNDEPTETASDDAPARTRRSKLDVMRSLLSRMNTTEFATAKTLWDEERQARKAVFDNM